jgi:hypothetical protein
MSAVLIAGSDGLTLAEMILRVLGGKPAENLGAGYSLDGSSGLIKSVVRGVNYGLSGLTGSGPVVDATAEVLA